MGLLFLIEVARYVQGIKNRKLVTFFQYITQKSVAVPFVFSCDAKHSNIFYGVPVMFIDTCFLAQRECRNFLPEPCNTNRGEELPSLFRLFQVGLFSRQAWYIAANQPYVHQTSQKKACIRPCDTNNSTQSLTRIYLHTATESLYRLHGANIVGHPS